MKNKKIVRIVRIHGDRIAFVELPFQKTDYIIEDKKIKKTKGDYIWKKQKFIIRTLEHN